MKLQDLKKYKVRPRQEGKIDYEKVREILEGNSWSNFAENLLDSLDKYGKLTQGQLAYVLGEVAPNGKPTFESRWRKQDGYSEKREEDERGRIQKGRQEERGVEAEKKGAKEDGARQEGGKTAIAPQSVDGLIPTSSYKVHKYPFKFFNPVQSVVFPYVEKDCNLVISAQTSAGKTIAAELVMDIVLSQKVRNKIIYLSPLKSLTQEKYADWQKRFKKKDIVILTGDYSLSKEMHQKLSTADIIVMTSEMADSRTRKYHAEKNFWLKQVGLLIVDESHIISTERGHAVETGVMRFTKINPDARIILLSATMPNVDELADWLRALNAKESFVLKNDWRPVELNFSFPEYPTRTKWGREDYWASQAAKRELAIKVVMSKPEEKFLVFCHDKGTLREIVKLLKENGENRVEAHNADLDLASRLVVEESFQDRTDKGLRVLVSTSTLAWGRNLPARNVVIVGVHRGINEVDQLDVIQMAGRAGRYGIDDEGFVYLILPEGAAELWAHLIKNPRPIKSMLCNDDTLGFHVLAEIYNREVKTPSDILSWYSRSLAFRQKMEIDLSGAIHLALWLRSLQMLEGQTEIERGSSLSLTGLGKVSAWLYYPPKDIAWWYRNLSRVLSPEGGRLDDISLSWALGDIPSNNPGFLSKEIPPDLLAFWQDKLSRIGASSSNTIPSIVAIHTLLQGGEPKTAFLGALQRGVVYDIDRITQAVKLIDKMYAKWDKDKVWETLSLRVRYGVPEEMTELVRIPKVGRARAQMMWKKGIKSVGDVVSKKSALFKTFDKKMATTILEGAKNLLKEEQNGKDKRD